MMLPNGWKKVKLGDVVKMSSGGTPSKDNASFWNGDIPWISALEMHKNFVEVAKLNITEDALKKGSSLAKKNDLLLLTRGSMLWKRIPVCLCLRDVAFNQDVKCLHANKKLNSTFLLYWFGCMESKIMHMVVGTGIGAGKLESSGILDLDVNLPPLEEQKKIAATLSVWDSAIEKMEKLIDAKENELNIVLRQNLLEKGIALKWKEIPLTEILKSVTPPSKIHQDSYLNSGKYPIVDQSKDLIAGWTNDESSVLKINRPLIIFGDHTCALKIMHMPFAQGADGIKILSAKDGYDPTYIYYAIKANPVIPEGYKRHFSALMLKSILCPSLEEQKKYAVYFKSLDEEISLLKQQLENYKKQKQGLMQKLLTGEWRVK